MEVDDVGLPEGLRLTSFSGGQPEAAFFEGKAVMADRKEINIYWARVGRKP